MSLAKWARIEPHAQTTDLNVGLVAEVADPLWLLARQLQLGELVGDDGGTAVAVHVHASWSRFTRLPNSGGITMATSRSPARNRRSRSR